MIVPVLGDDRISQHVDFPVTVFKSLVFGLTLR